MATKRKSVEFNNKLLDIIHKEATSSKLESTEELITFHERICLKAREVMVNKNSDYGADKDPFRNFHGFGAFGILVRLSDKISRMRSFLEKLKQGKALAVISESVEDTAIDAINYVILFLGYIRTWGAEK